MKHIFLIFFISVITFSCASKQIITIDNSKSLGDIYGKTYILSNMFQVYEVTILFKDGKFSGKGPVNRYFGGYKIEGSTIEISSIASTRMGGAPKDMKNEELYFSMIGRAVKIETDKNGNIILTTDDNEKLIYTEEVTPVK